MSTYQQWNLPWCPLEHRTVTAFMLLLSALCHSAFHSPFQRKNQIPMNSMPMPSCPNNYYDAGLNRRDHDFLRKPFLCQPLGAPALRSLSTNSALQYSKLLSGGRVQLLIICVAEGQEVINQEWGRSNYLKNTLGCSRGQQQNTVNVICSFLPVTKPHFPSHSVKFSLN